MMANIQKPALFRNLFELACFYSGSIVSYNKLIGQLNDAGNTTTLSHYQQLLSGAGLASGLEKFSNTLIKTRSSSPKWQIHNMALQSAMSKLLFNDIIQDAQQWGHQIESVVGTYLLSASLTGTIELFYWRDGNYEVDFVIRKGESVLGIEVKSGLKSSNSGMGAFKKSYPSATTILVGTSGIPWQEFISLDINKWIP
jgi:predicted AAA+ superfamily ATPase